MPFIMLYLFASAIFDCDDRELLAALADVDDPLTPFLFLPAAISAATVVDFLLIDETDLLLSYTRLLLW